MSISGKRHILATRLTRDTPRSFVVAPGLPVRNLLVLEDLPVVDSLLVEHFRAACVADLGLGVGERRVTLQQGNRSMTHKMGRFCATGRAGEGRQE